MSALILLHSENPLLVWCAVGALLISGVLATGEGRLVWPALAAAVTGAFAAAGMRGPLEPCVFAGLLGLEAAVAFALRRRTARALPSAGPKAPVVVITPATPRAETPSETLIRREEAVDLAPVRRFGS